VRLGPARLVFVDETWAETGTETGAETGAETRAETGAETGAKTSMTRTHGWHRRGRHCAGRFRTHAGAP
jgi:hypothetical protein